MLASWLLVRMNLASLPTGTSWIQLYGVAWLGGIGFTMSLFIAELGLDGPDQLAAAKLGILAASLIAGVGGYLLLRVWATRAGAPTDG